MVLSGKVCQSLLLAQAAGCDDATSFQRLTNMTNSRLVVDPLHEQTQVGKGVMAPPSQLPIVQHTLSAQEWLQRSCTLPDAAAQADCAVQQDRHCTLHAAVLH